MQLPFPKSLSLPLKLLRISSTNASRFLRSRLSPERPRILLGQTVIGPLVQHHQHGFWRGDRLLDCQDETCAGSSMGPISSTMMRSEFRALSMPSPLPDPVVQADPVLSQRGRSFSSASIPVARSLDQAAQSRCADLCSAYPGPKRRPRARPTTPLLSAPEWICRCRVTRDCDSMDHTAPSSSPYSGSGFPRPYLLFDQLLETASQLSVRTRAHGAQVVLDVPGTHRLCCPVGEQHDN